MLCGFSSLSLIALWCLLCEYSLIILSTVNGHGLLVVYLFHFLKKVFKSKGVDSDAGPFGISLHTADKVRF